MKIFVTGATGFVGYAVTTEMSRAGHNVVGLSRTAEKGSKLAVSEVRPVIGDMSKPETYADALRDAQVLIHCAAEYSERYMELDRATVDVLLNAAEESGRPRLLVYTSGCWVYGDTGNDPVDESSVLRPPQIVAPRVETEQRILARNTHMLRTIVLRPGCVYGGAGGLTAAWFESAQKEGAARIVGDGRSHWTMVHISDLAVAYRLAAESYVGGEVFNVSDRSRATVLECAKAATRAVNGGDQVVTTAVEEALTVMGATAECLALDQHVDASKAMRVLGWNPRHGGFVDGVVRYHQSWKASFSLT